MGRPTYDDDELQLGEIIRANAIAFRKELGLSQSRAAQIAGMAVSSLSKIESGVRKVASTTSIQKLSLAYGRPREHFEMVDPPPREDIEPTEQAFRMKVSPGVDQDLADRARAALAKIEREHLRRLRDRKLKKDDE